MIGSDAQRRDTRDGKDDQKGIKTHPSDTISEMVRAFKSFSARRINLKRNTPGATVWQRGFYEHIIRDEVDLNRIRACSYKQNGLLTVNYWFGYNKN